MRKVLILKHQIQVLQEVNAKLIAQNNELNSLNMQLIDLVDEIGSENKELLKKLEEKENNEN